MSAHFQNDWEPLLQPEFGKDYYLRLREFLKHEYRERTIYPGMYDIFNAMHFTAYSGVIEMLSKSTHLARCVE